MKEDAEAEANPWKGRPSSFFVMKKLDGPVQDPQNPENYELNQEQWSFMYMYYPEYCGAPYDMMTWLFGQVKANEDLYNKPAIGGSRVTGAGSDEDEPLSLGKDTSFG